MSVKLARKLSLARNSNFLESTEDQKITRFKTDPQDSATQKRPNKEDIMH